MIVTIALRSHAPVAVAQLWIVRPHRTFMLPRPPEALVRKLVPLLAKIIGIAFIVGGSIFLIVGLVLLFVHGQNTLLIGAVFIVGSIFDIAIGFVIVRFAPRFMLGIFERLRQKI
ncbi:MAG: hypothetical protein ACREFE_13990 [Limisphaerales bacterium]